MVLVKGSFSRESVEGKSEVQVFRDEVFEASSDFHS